MAVWDWATFWSFLGDFNFLAAAWTTVKAAVVGEVGGVFLGLVLALLRMSRSSWLRAISDVYVWAWRGSPLLVQVLLLYFGLPQVGIRLSVVVAGLLALVLNEGAYMSVIIRAGLMAIGAGQRDAARALGLNGRQILRFVEIPQAARLVVPALGNQFNSMMKTTALLSVISFSELLRYTNQVVSETYQPLEAFAVAALYYLALSSIWSIIQMEIEARLAVGTGTRGVLGRIHRMIARTFAVREVAS